jgi:glyoxylase-like metal-dependent hydrolase (beta-lactamase superfamily II)
VRLGKFELEILSSGSMAMDGGLIFGIVPRVMWEKVTPPDEKNRVRLGLNVLLIRTGKHNVIVDTGCGEGLSPKLAEIHSLDGLDGLRLSLGEFGLSFADITIVIPSHLHFDHAGGITLEEKGRIVPAFPNARYFVQKKEYQEWQFTNERTRGGYRSVFADVVRDAGLLELLEGESEVIPGVKCVPTPGHTEGHHSVLVEAVDGQAVLFTGDVCPIRHNIPLAWSTGNDVLPMVQMETKRNLWKKALENNWTLVFPHEIKPRFFKSDILGNTRTGNK